jgi:hypothetical protein
MSAVNTKADIDLMSRNVRFVPIGNIVDTLGRDTFPTLLRA